MATQTLRTNAQTPQRVRERIGMAVDPAREIPILTV